MCTPPSGMGQLQFNSNSVNFQGSQQRAIADITASDICKIQYNITLNMSFAQLYQSRFFSHFAVCFHLDGKRLQCNLSWAAWDMCGSHSRRHWGRRICCSLCSGMLEVAMVPRKGHERCPALQFSAMLLPPDSQTSWYGCVELSCEVYRYCLHGFSTKPALLYSGSVVPLAMFTHLSFITR